MVEVLVGVDSVILADVVVTDTIVAKLDSEADVLCDIAKVENNILIGVLVTVVDM